MEAKNSGRAPVTRSSGKSSKPASKASSKQSSRAASRQSSRATSRQSSRKNLTAENTNRFAQTKEEMIDYYLQLAKEYKDLLSEHNDLIEQRKTVETEIASIYCQEERLDQLIRDVKRKKLKENA